MLRTYVPRQANQLVQQSNQSVIYTLHVPALTGPRNETAAYARSSGKMQTALLPTKQAQRLVRTRPKLNRKDFKRNKRRT